MIYTDERFEELSNQLRMKKVRLTDQRLKILEYIIDNSHHPTVEEIYMDLHKGIPTLSKTTVYNTLNTLIDANLVRLVDIDDNEAHFDPVIEDHGHFKCESCGKIYDFEINIDALAGNDLKGFKITNKNVYFKGICPRCLVNIN